MEDHWESFLAYVARARAKPGFDAEQRELKLAYAGRLTRVLEIAREGGDWLGEFNSTTSQRGFAGYASSELTERHQDRWLATLAAAAPEPVRQAMAGFLDRQEDPVGRFARFARVAEDALGPGKAGENQGTVITLGSLFNFVTAPRELPVLRSSLFGALHRLLKGEPLSTGSATDEYEAHLAFARELEARMRAAGIPVRDMLDVQVLMFDAASHRGFWAGPTPPREREQHLEADAYLAVCACLGFDAPYLLEWIEFHRLVGVQRFFLYNNGDRDTQREMLAPYVEEGLVVLHDWPVFPPMMAAHRHCLEHHRDEARWIAFLDTDEFLFSPTARPLPELLAGYERFPGVGVNWAMFGPGGHRTKPPGLVIESYTQQLDLSPNTKPNRPLQVQPFRRWVKSIVDPHRVVRGVTVHTFVFDSQALVDENEYPIRGGVTKSISYSRLRINHYRTKSVEEFLKKLETRSPDLGDARRQPDMELLLEQERTNSRPDTTILHYVPALRDALARRAALT